MLGVRGGGGEGVLAPDSWFKEQFVATAGADWGGPGWPGVEVPVQLNSTGTSPATPAQPQLWGRYLISLNNWRPHLSSFYFGFQTGDFLSHTHSFFRSLSISFSNSLSISLSLYFFLSLLYSLFSLLFFFSHCACPFLSVILRFCFHSFSFSFLYFIMHFITCIQTQTFHYFQFLLFSAKASTKKLQSFLEKEWTEVFLSISSAWLRPKEPVTVLLASNRKAIEKRTTNAVMKLKEVF